MGSVANGRYCCVDGQMVPHFSIHSCLWRFSYHASLFSVTEADSTSTSPDVTVASASIANTARTLVFAEMVIVCTRARTKGAAAPGFCTVRPCRQSIEVSSRELAYPRHPHLTV